MVRERKKKERKRLPPWESRSARYSRLCAKKYRERGRFNPRKALSLVLWRRRLMRSPLGAYFTAAAVLSRRLLTAYRAARSAFNLHARRSKYTAEERKMMKEWAAEDRRIYKTLSSED